MFGFSPIPFPAMLQRVLLVEDHPIALAGLRAMLDAEPDLSVVGEAVSAPGALDRLRETDVDLVVTDVRIEGSDGIELTKSIRALWPALPVLVLSAHDEAIYAERAIRAGASGYVMKTEPAAVIRHAIQEALAGRVYLSSPMREHIVETYRAGGSAAPLAVLTDRELEVYGHFGHGLTTAQVAETMLVSPKTVESHRVNIKRKLGIETTNEFMQRASLWAASTGT